MGMMGKDCSKYFLKAIETPMKKDSVSLKDLLKPKVSERRWNLDLQKLKDSHLPKETETHFLKAMLRPKRKDSHLLKVIARHFLKATVMLNLKDLHLDLQRPKDLLRQVLFQ